MKYVRAWCLLSAFIVCSGTAFGEEADKIYFENIKDRSLYVVVERRGEQKFLNIDGVLLKPQSNSYIEYLEAGDDSYLTGILSSDGSRILVSLGHIDEKNLWLVNLKTAKLEFETHENAGRHLFPKWLDASRFELMYGGMGYRVEREYTLNGNAWKLTRDKTFTE